MKPILAISLISIATGGLVSCGSQTSSSIRPAPNFTLEDLESKKVSLADFRGKVVLLNFWGIM
jgi:cytochrome oxidase Cu insertion factor (SCO1/SenC/PrrC family)